jgi:uncharacterized protein
MADAAWQLLEDLPVWHVAEIPRRAQARQLDPAGADRCDHGRAQRLQALITSFHHGGPIAVGWDRERPGDPIRVLIAGQSLVGGEGDGHAVLTLPAGGRGDPVPPGAAARSFAAMPCWVRIGGIVDGLANQVPDSNAPDTPPSLEDGLLTAWSGPFAWLVMAEPAGPEQLAQLTEDVNLAHLLAQRSDSPRGQLTARRLEVRHAELRKAAAAGLWRVHLLAGGESPGAAARIAGLLCASADVDSLPYELAPIPGYGGLEKVLDGASTQAVAGDARADHEPVQAEAPFWASSRLLAAVARPPAREVPGIRFVLMPNFDVTRETAPEDTGPPAGTVTQAPPGLPLGTVLDWNRAPAGRLVIPESSLNRHTFVCGATGAGKSQTVRGLLETASAKGIPWLVVEPAKAEYKLMAARLPGTEVIRIRPGEVDQPPPGINPLEPAPGPDGARFPLQTHADLVRALFLAAFEADEPFPQVLAAALTRCYEDAGWDLVTGEPAAHGGRPGYPTLSDLQTTAMQVVEEIGYGREITDNVRGFVRVRISSLRLGTTGRFFEGGHPLDFSRLLGHNVVLEIEDAGDDRDKAFLMGTVLIRLTEYLRMRQRAEGGTAPRLRHLAVFEEAHRLLRNPQGPDAGPAAHAVEMFAGLLAEIRAYGEGLIIAEQIPAKLVPDVIKNTAVKIVHRLPAADDREAVGATMNVTDEQSQYLVTLVPGEAAVFTDGMDYPLLARMPDGTAREIERPALTVSPASLISRRSPTCGPDCRATPCTLRQMRAAQRAAIDDPRITLWAELSVLAHLTGWTMPMPAAPFAADLRAMDLRLRDCALSHAVGTAATSRASVITARVSPPALAEHVVAAMRAALDEERWLCDRQEPQWLAPAYRWALVLDSLKNFHRNNHDAGRHPRSAEWEATYRRTIRGTTCARQLGTVQRWYDADQRKQPTVHAVAYGARADTAIEQAIGSRVGDEDWEQRLADSLTAFRECRWPSDCLRPGRADAPTGA